MAEFQTVMREFERMCKSCDCIKSDDCPLSICGFVDCSEYAVQDPSTFEKCVMDWARDNPEPAAQTWGEWMVERGFLPDGWSNATNSLWLADQFRKLMNTEVPPNIADKLAERAVKWDA